MWTVTGKTVSGKDVSYNVATSKDTDKAFVLALAFQSHGRATDNDPLTINATVEWTSDNISALSEPIVLRTVNNYGVDRRTGVGEWVRHSVRAFRSQEAAEEALESAATESPDDVFRIVRTTQEAVVVASSKNAGDTLTEKPLPEEGEQTSIEVEDKPKTAKAKGTPKAA